ncbi:hypothetical protein [Kinneretia aquatilis]|uniref:hypothetical protein n=1 Tax=Kinneretia aquatilis TaxID=2070761 RepID=UPI00149533D4|nr:hypothetical protein [Paucibacter aquatile]WIV97160.1 hypothetical protein K9V56_019415 [Paucibacter aquatile]
MSKIAVFVEGCTEAEFVIKILTALSGQRGIRIEFLRQNGGVLHFLEFRGEAASTSYALVANCTCDGQVKSQIKDRYKDLVAAGYTKIFGLRDVYPLGRGDIPKIEAALAVGLPQGDVPIDIHLAVMEIEAWFLDELTHFPRVHENLTIERIKIDGFDVVNVLGETWGHPADTLHQIYKLEGLAYNKKKSQIVRTIDALDAEEIYVTATARSPTLRQFVDGLEIALFPASV